MAHEEAAKPGADVKLVIRNICSGPFWTRTPLS